MKPVLLDLETARLVRKGRKTQRRWPVQWPAEELISPREQAYAQMKNGAPTGRWGWPYGEEDQQWLYAPVPGPGNVVYVRESFCLVSGKLLTLARRLNLPLAQNPDGKGKEWAVPRSGVQPVAGEPAERIGNTEVEWRSAIHMPPWAASQLLVVEELYLHRLAAISTAEVYAEGLSENGPGILDGTAARAAFAKFWDKRSPKGARFADDPMVVAVSFRLQGEP